MPVDAPTVLKTSPPEEPAAAATTGVGVPNVPTLEENFLEESGTPLPTNPPLTEREQQIAAARAARQVQTPMVKPRLSYILSGGEAPVPEENQSASHAGQKPQPDAPPDTKTLNE